MQTKSLRSEGKTIHYFDNEDRRVFHNWDGPAIVYDDRTKDEYYFYGQKMTKLEWSEAKRDFNGLPPAKDPNFKTAFVN